MFKDWSEYFFMLGSSAAALIGLMFVVATLTTGRDTKEAEQCKHLYTSPIVWHLGGIVVVSADHHAGLVRHGCSGPLTCRDHDLHP